MKQNYTNYSRSERKNQRPVDEAIPKTEPEKVEESTESAKPVEETVKIPPAPVTGIVIAERLYVRKNPNPNGEVVTVIAKDDKVQIDPSACTVGWYKVYTSTGLDGFCMRQFITTE